MTIKLTLAQVTQWAEKQHKAMVKGLAAKVAAGAITQEHAQREIACALANLDALAKQPATSFTVEVPSV